MYKKMLCCLLAFALVLVLWGVSAILPVDAEPMPDETIGSVTMQNDFTDDKVMVVLTHEASLQFIDYTPADFPEIECAEIEDLSSGMGRKVQAVLRGEELEMDSLGARFMNRNIDVDSFRRILCLKLANPGKGNVLRAVMALEQREDVYSAEPNYILPFGPVLPDAPSDIGWGFEEIELSYAQQIESGSSAVKVGIVDTGIDVSHPDLQNRVNTSLSRNFVDDSYSATTDPVGHGTHIAGIIGGTGNNTLGIEGICQNITLVSLRVVDASRYSTAGTVANAINYAEGNDISILNLSIDPDAIGSYLLHQALAVYSGVVVCAAGNDNVNTDSWPIIPGSWEYDNIICVGASTQANVKAPSSNYGQETVDLFAPGKGVSSCFPRALCASSNCSVDGHITYGYHFLSGTSMAAPMVTGVIALMISADSSLTCSDIKPLILNNVKNYAAFADLCVSGGVLNAKNIFSSQLFQ